MFFHTDVAITTEKKKKKPNEKTIHRMGGKLSANEVTEVVNSPNIQIAHATLYQRNNPTKKWADDCDRRVYSTVLS